MQDPNNQNMKPVYPPNDPPAAPVGTPPTPTPQNAPQPIMQQPVVQPEPARYEQTPQVPERQIPVSDSQPTDIPSFTQNQKLPVDTFVRETPVHSAPISTPPQPTPPMTQAPPTIPTPYMQTAPVNPPAPPMYSQHIPQATQSPMSVLTPPPNTPPLYQAVPASSVAASFTPKSRFPKLALIASLVLLIIVISVYGIFQFMGNRTGVPVGIKGEIKWWGLQLDEEAVAPLISEYESKHEGIKISYTKQSPTDYRERLTNALASGDGPDIFEVHNSWPTMFKNNLATLPASIMPPAEFKGTFYGVIATDLTTPTGIVGIPLYYDALTLYVNDDLFAAALKTPPKTWIDVQLLADPTKGLTQKDSDGKIIQSAIALGTTENISFWPDILGLMLFQNKANFVDLESPATKDVLSFYQYFGVPTGNWDATLPVSVEAFAKQKTAMIIAPSSSAYAIIQTNPTLHFKTYPLPQLPKENPNDPDFSYATYWVESVWEKSASKEASWEFLKFMASSESLQKINQTLKSNSKTQRAYPIPSLNQQFANDPILGSVVSLAKVAKSWYLADQTFDGDTGLNTQLKKAYAKALSQDPDTAQTEITKILTQYGIATAK